MNAEPAFERGYLCRPFSHPDRILMDLASEYHDRTERYDRTVCTGEVRNGSIMPSCGEERCMINTNAKKVHKELLFKAQQFGFTREQWQRAIWDAAPH